MNGADASEASTAATPPGTGSTRPAAAGAGSPGLVHRLVDPLILRFHHLIRELGKFGLVGAATYGIDLGIFVSLRLLMGTPVVPKIIATVIAATVAFLGNRYWTWRHRPRNGLHREYVLYFVFNAIGLGIALGCLRVSHYWLGAYWPVLQSPLADVISSSIVGMALGTIFRFWAYRRFVFPAAKPEPSSVPGSQPAPDSAS